MRAFAFAVLAVSMVGCADDDFVAAPEDSGSTAETSVVADSAEEDGTVDSTTPDTAATDGTISDSTASDSAVLDSTADSAHDSALIDSMTDPADSITASDSVVTPDVVVTETISGDECLSEADCRAYSSYCSTAPCVCIALAKTAPDPACSGVMGTCIVDPCKTKKATCVSGKCVLAPKTESM